ncbi:MAG: hypothetical protein B7Z12_20340 [Caulobacter vibrioides]|uniref:Uncharacterized protein n=1 Tax=Caulobacter vibrioides TaxID=155892 RepID=A0A258CRK3_CAUVI|nr:MAG: hypothetical protein B7Z12_20340 [Caulobacter vibrioides]
MKSGHGAGLLRIYTNERAIVGDRALFELVVERAHAAGLAGATVLRGRLGYGRSTQIHTHRLFDLADELPLVIEIIDEEPALRAFTDSISDLDKIGVITLEKVEVLHASERSVAGARHGGSNE